MSHDLRTLRDLIEEYVRSGSSESTRLLKDRALTSDSLAESLQSDIYNGL